MEHEPTLDQKSLNERVESFEFLPVEGERDIFAENLTEIVEEMKSVKPEAVDINLLKAFMDKAEYVLYAVAGTSVVGAALLNAESKQSTPTNKWQVLMSAFSLLVTGAAVFGAESIRRMREHKKSP